VVSRTQTTGFEGSEYNLSLILYSTAVVFLEFRKKSEGWISSVKDQQLISLDTLPMG